MAPERKWGATMVNLDGKVALVTGGGSGLGEAACHVLAAAGARVVVGDINVEAAERVAESAGERRPKATWLKLDVSDAGQAREAIDQTVSRQGRLDYLLNCAGIDRTLPVDELSPKEWDRVLAVNLTGPFLMSKYAIPAMQAQGRGHIVNIVSTAAKRAWANASVYHASKWGLLGLSYALHVEGRPRNIKVTAIVAGGMRTPFLLDRFPDIDQHTLQDPRNVAETILFVLSQPEETVIPEVMVLPMRETSWP